MTNGDWHYEPDDLTVGWRGGWLHEACTQDGSRCEQVDDEVICLGCGEKLQLTVRDEPL